MNVFPKDKNGNIYIGQNPFASKNIGDKSLFTRLHGIQFNCVAGLNTIDFSIPYNHCKITGVELVNCENLDIVDFEVLDTPNGLISGVPSLKLNQFGFSVNLTKEKYEQRSNYDADVYKDMVLRFKYTSLSAKTIGINFNLHEVK